jgi:hypothetical protein
VSGDARPARALLWLLGGALAAAALVRLAEVSAVQLDAPVDLYYETPNLRTLQLVQAGRDPYDPAVYAAPPYWLSPYTPLYAQLVAAFPADPGNPFHTGRVVSLCSFVLAAASLLVVGGRAVPPALLALAAFLLVRPSAAMAAYLKGDSLGLLFSVVTVLAVQRAARGAGGARGLGWLVLGALAGAAAFLTKQSLVAAAAAGLAWLLLVDRRRALLFAGLYALFVAAPLAWMWSDGFRFCVFESLRNELGFWRITGWWAIMASQPVFMLLVAWSAVAGVIGCMRPRRSGWLRAPFALYALTSTAVLFATLGKAGSWVDYFLEPALAALLALVEAGRHGWSGAGRLAAPRVLPAATVAAVLLLGTGVVELGWEPGADVPVRFVTPASRAHREQLLAVVADAIRSRGVPDPLILNLFDTMLSYPLPGTICRSDTYHYSLLYDSGRLEVGPVVSAIAAHTFDGVFVTADLLETPAPSTPMGAIQRALQRDYRIGVSFGQMDYLVPKGPRLLGEPGR